MGNRFRGRREIKLYGLEELHSEKERRFIVASSLGALLPLDSPSITDRECSIYCDEYSSSHEDKEAETPLDSHAATFSALAA
jgi:hypothetical protein